MMKTSTRVLSTMAACALCALMAGGAAYAITPDQGPTTPETVAASDSLATAYDNTVKLMEICGAQ